MHITDVASRIHNYLHATFRAPTQRVYKLLPAVFVSTKNYISDVNNLELARWSVAEDRHGQPKLSKHTALG